MKQKRIWKKKSHQLVVFCLMVIMAFMRANSIYASEYVAIETDNAESGFITIYYNKPLLNKKPNVFIYCNDKLYLYNIATTETNLPLQLGDGEYRILIRDYIERTYQVVAEETLIISGLSEKEVYINSIQMIDYNNNKNIIDEINLLFTDAKNDKEKCEILYNHIISNYSYSHKKAETIKSGYLPDLHEFTKSKKGICYDFASLFAAVLRSNNIPTKLVMGYRDDNIGKYHAWNEVLIDGDWLTIDTTTDAQLVQAGKSVTMVNDGSIFQAVRVY